MLNAGQFYAVPTSSFTAENNLHIKASQKVYVYQNVFAPNALSPFSQSGNSHFTLYSKDPLPILHLAIFDRWGEHVFDAKNISTNALQEGWDGTFKGKRVDGGVYVFYAEVEVLPGRTALIKGDITVLY